MALKPCRECKIEISSRAKVCPHCGLKKPHQGSSARGINALANGLMKLGLLLILLPLLGMCVFALAGEHRRLAGDALWAKECFILQAPVELHPASRRSRSSTRG